MRLFLAGALCAIAMGCATARTEDRRFDAVRAKLQRAVAEEKVASISVAVAVDGSIVWQEAFGWADRERRIAATAETQYPIASISKPMTATAVLRLADRGLLDISKPVTAYLGEGAIRAHADDASVATVRAVLQHRAGFAEHNQYYYGAEIARRPPIEETIRRYAIVAYPAGVKYRYSNVGYGVLEALIARVSGTSYETFMRDGVFGPLAMRRTSVGPAPGSAMLHDENGKPIPAYDFASRGSGYIFSTAADVIRFALAHDETRAQMLRERHSTGTATGRFGLDWYCGLGICGRDETAFGFAWYGHDGGMPGASARLKIAPAANVAVVALSNSRQGLTYDIVDEILDIFLPQYVTRRKDDPSLAPAAPRAPSIVSDRLRGRWSGEIVSATRRSPIVLTIGASEIRMRAGAEECVLDDVRVEDAAVSGGCRIRLPIDDAPDENYDVWLNVELRGAELIGTASAYSPPPRYRFHLPTWVRLTADK